jgi:transcriptional regulator with XRE-family HTH domain
LHYHLNIFITLETSNLECDMDMVGKIPVDQSFSVRLAEACEKHAKCPSGHGRLAWIRREFNEQTGDTVTLETVRKWMSGESWPRRSKMDQLAEILGVTRIWLESGHEAQARNGAAVLASTIPIIVRPGATVEISGLPHDLTFSEAKRVANIIMAHAIVE